MIGYNVSQANSLMEEIANSYNKVGSVISDGWPSVSSTMQQYWIGEDEQSYEDAFCKRMCEMYVKAAQVVTDLLNNLKNLGESWHTFQQENKIEGADSPATFAANFNAPTITQNDKIISYNPASVDDSTNRGVQEGASTSIQNSMSSYLTGIKSELQNLYAGIESSNAFLGSTQAKTIQSYIQAIGDALASVVTAAQDIYDAVEQLANTSYSESEETSTVEFNSSKASEVESELGSMKWQG